MTLFNLFKKPEPYQHPPLYKYTWKVKVYDTTDSFYEEEFILSSRKTDAYVRNDVFTEMFARRDKILINGNVATKAPAVVKVELLSFNIIEYPEDELRNLGAIEIDYFLRRYK